MELGLGRSPVGSGGLLRWGRYKQTAHLLNSSLQSVTVSNPIHPLYGQSLPVLSIRHYDDHTLIVVTHPDGGVLSLADWECDLSSFSVEHASSGLLALEYLLKLVQLVSENSSDSLSSSKENKSESKNPS